MKGPRIEAFPHKDSTLTMKFKRFAPVVDNLVETLKEEASVLERLEEGFARQMGALRDGDPGALKEATSETQKQVGRAQELKETRKRQVGLLSRMIGKEGDSSPAEKQPLKMDHSLSQVTERIKAETGPEATGKLRQLEEAWALLEQNGRAAGQKSQALQRALRRAAEINHNLVTAMQEAVSTGSSSAYTEDGTPVTPSSDQSLVNTTG